MLGAVADPGPDGERASDPSARRPASTWRLIVGLFAVVAFLLALDLARAPGPDPLALSLAVAITALAGLAIIYHREVLILAKRQHAEAESLNRILQGLSRSTSPDAVLGAIVDELRVATGADHCVIVRRRARSPLLDATLVSSSAGVPATTTTFPAALLEVPPSEPDGRGAGAGPAPGPDGTAAAADRISEEAGSFFGLTNRRAAALVTSHGVVGALVLSRRSGERWGPAALRLLGEAAREASAALDRAYEHVATETAATTDLLTGLPNRRFLEILAARPAGRRREDRTAVLMVDIDHFKRLNDRYGHGVGDEVLRSVADALARTVRADDFPIRYGGEEFLLVLRRADREIAVAVAERLRRNVAGIDPLPLGISAPVTVSVGAAVAERDDDRLADLIARADVALYQAKAAGRDRVVVDEAPRSPP